MTGTLYGNAQYHWERGFFFGAALGALAAILVYTKCKRPTEAQWKKAFGITEVVAGRQVHAGEEVPSQSGVALR
jgi:hypothetical protein